MRLMFYCQHVLGMGHLVRSLELVRALSRRFEVLFVSGGEITPDIDIPRDVQLIRLPVLRTDSDFGNLHSSAPEAQLEDIKRERKQMLLSLLDSRPSDVLVTEMYPFGRKQFDAELLPLLQAANRRGMFVVSSVRDILVRKQDHESFERRVVDITNAYYDLVLIHGDPRLIAFDESFSKLADLQCDVAYTGYVTQDSAETVSSKRGADGCPSIVVSVGGGRCENGHALLRSVLEAARVLAGVLPHRFDVFAGPYVQPDVLIQLQATAEGLSNVSVQRYTPNLTGRMRDAELSISMGGYNTVMNILLSGIRSLVYTAVGNGDREQDLRASKLESLNVLRVIGSLDPQALAAQICDALRFSPASLQVDLEGARQSARLVESGLAGRAIYEGLCREASV